MDMLVSVQQNVVKSVINDMMPAALRYCCLTVKWKVCMSKFEPGRAFFMCIGLGSDSGK